ncbi:MAG: hypothetical protein CBC27_06335 [Opitutia bacterium TMED67]|nr:hypothetical protein [Verrucomicrobiales bacterium]OUU72173.1 MAG: hypothetical protein CBC27_06335 [Opitutae bacterium TMED67]|tara:strand:- start:1752 stop:2558 length:807 start_codon:yes stop_codon:yes gene_type:complete
MKNLLFCFSISFCPIDFSLKAEPDPTPLPQAHSHNDYYHKRPLLDALANGFCSVEADVFLRNGKLLIGHSRFELRDSRSLERLYLKPLAKRVQAKGGSVYKAKVPFYLMIDFKTDGPKTYAILQPLLEKYRFMLTEFKSGNTKVGAVTVVISGSRPREIMEKQSRRLVGYDGRLSDLGQNPSPHFMPWISDSWKSHFKWNGKGYLSKSEEAKLNGIIQQVRNNGQKLRFWATPDIPASWALFHNAGVDFINTDKLDSFAKFLREARSK